MRKKKKGCQSYWGQREKVQCMMGMLCRKEDNKIESVSGNEQTRIPQTDQVRDTQSSSKSQVTNLMSSANTKGFE